MPPRHAKAVAAAILGTLASFHCGTEPAGDDSPSDPADDASSRSDGNPADRTVPDSGQLPADAGSDVVADARPNQDAADADEPDAGEDAADGAFGDAAPDAPVTPLHGVLAI